MKIFLSINPEKDIYNQIELAKSIGYDGVEIVLEGKVRETVLSEKEKVRKILEKNKMYFCFHLPNWLNPLDENDLKEILELKKIVDEFNTFGIVHLEIEDKRKIRKINKLPKEMKQNIFFENLFQSVDILERIAYLDVKFVIDISHFLTSNSFEKLKNFLEKAKNKIFHFHLSDGNGFSHSHLPLGHGIFPIREIISILLKNFNDRTITLEIFEHDIPEIEYEISLNLLKDLIKKEFIH